MDPTINQNPVPTPMPEPTPGPAPVTMPPVTAPQPGGLPVQPQSQSVQPAQPLAQPVQPTQTVQPAQPVAPVPPVAPVNPIINPGAQPAPVNPVFTPTGGGMVAATDPITMPAPPKAPDPVEEEFKAPLRAADPVPGSIGSAISMPVDNTAPKTPSVAFTDPATTENTMVNSSVKPVKKKTSKSTLIALAVVAGMVVIALATVLVLQLNGILTF